MSSNALFVFGDQTGDVRPTVQELARLVSGHPILHDFFRQSIDCLKSVITDTENGDHRRLIRIDSLPELVVAIEKHHSRDSALTAALLCIVQLGAIITHLEVNPRALEASETSPVILGICTGALTAAAISCCRNIAEVSQIATGVVKLAYQLGSQSSRRSRYIDPSGESWAYIVSNINAPEADKAIELFNEQSVLEASEKAYISSRCSSSITISGPPPTLSCLFSHVPLFKTCRRIPLPLSSAFHASHLQPVSWTRLTKGLSDELLNLRLRHPNIISPSSGQPYTGANFSDLLVQVVDDILQVPIDLEATFDGLSQAVRTQATLIRFGPVNSAAAIKKSLDARGVHLVEAERTRQIISPRVKHANDIAIVGMAARLPQSETLEEFWQVLEQGRDLHEKIRPDRFNVDTHFDISGKAKNTSLTPYGVFIDRPGYFDTRLFNMSPREAAQTDPQQRLMLLTTYEALEMAGYRPDATPSTNIRKIGSFIGQTSDDYREVNAGQNIDTYFITGGIRAFGPGRLNYHFGWEGPSYSVDTACSSSSASIQLACSALLARECDTAVGGGANILTNSDLFAGLSRGSFLSKTGGCKTFDHDADGYVRADAVGVVVLKRLDDAIADRDNILAVLKGATTNHSAEAVSITHPHADTQERLFNAVLDKSGLHPHEIDYVELHGTGTQAGDATESRSVTNVLAQGRASPLYMGTVKPNIGHGEAASGVSSLIKAVMMFRKNSIPPHVGIKGRINQKLPPLGELNTHISFGKTPFLARAGGDGKRRILINNFDAAGGNTSMVIEEPPLLETYDVDPRSHHIVAISGKTTSALLNNSKRLLQYVKENRDVRIEDIAYTTTARRMHHGLRRAHAASSIKELISSLEKSIEEGNPAKEASSPPSVVFLFTGQGSCYLSMAKELFDSYTPFRENIQDYERICTAHGFASFLPIITDESLEISQATPVQVQLAIVCVEMAVAALWKSLGVMPSAVIGHSLGEYPALYTAGVISLSDCLYLVGKRASIMLSNCTVGTHSMLAVHESIEKVESLLLEFGNGTTECEVACVNSPRSTVISGAVEHVGKLQQFLGSRAVKNTILGVQYAFHSSQMDPVLDEYSAVAGKVYFRAPCIPFASTLLGEVVTDEGVINSQYLMRQTRDRVQFVKALQSLKATFNSNRRHIWIETGPNPVCLGLARSTFASEEILLPSLKRNEGDWGVLSNSLARVYAAGIDVDWTSYHRPYELCVRLLELPSYAFDLKNYWIQYEGDWAIQKGEIHDKIRPGNSFSTTCLHRILSEVHDASGVAVTFETDASDPKLNKALRGHLVNGAGLCSSSVYADMAFTAAGYIQGTLDPLSKQGMDVRHMEVRKPLLIQPGDTKQVIRVKATKAASSNVVEVSLSSQDGQAHQDHAHCVVAFGDGNEWVSDWARNAYLIKSRMDQLIASSLTGQTHKILRPMAYKLFAALVDYDPKYQGMEEVYMDSKLFEATAKVKFQADDSDGSFTYSPYWIDSLTHLSGFVLNGADTTPADSVFISHGWGSLKIVGSLSAEKLYQSYVRMQETKTPGVMAGDVYFFDHNQVVAVCQDLKFQRIKRAMLDYLLPRSSGPNVPAPKLAASKSTKETPVRTTRSGVKRKEPSVARGVVSGFDNILSVIASEVGVELSELDDDASFTELGVDSLLSISIVAKLGELLGRNIPATLFNDLSCVRDLRAYFSGKAFGTTTPSEDSSDDEGLFSGEESYASTTVSTTVRTPDLAGQGSLDVVREIIASEIGVGADEIDEETPLSEYGVDSLLSLSIMSAINSQTGRNLTPSFLMDNPTLAAIQLVLGYSPPTAPQLAKAIGKAKDKIPTLKAESVLLQSSPSARGPALFLLPDGSGSASSYVGLPTIKTCSAVYGLNSPYLASPASFNTPLQSVVEMYVQEIRRVQPHGPYLLGGWSIGGTYAFEAASQLIREHGEKVDSLILIDAPCPKTLPPLPLETIDLLEKIGAFSGLQKRNTTSSALGIREGVKDHFRGSVNALKRYQPTPINPDQAPISVTAIWARNGVWETVGEDAQSRYEKTGGGGSAASDWIMDPRQDYKANGWDILLPGVEISYEVVTGDHFSIMRRPGVEELGNRLAEVMGKL